MVLTKKNKNKFFYILLGISSSVLIIVVIILSFKLIQISNNPEQIAQNEIKKVVNIVDKLIILPEDELPIIATVTNLEALKDQPFFVNAKVGDKILIYTKAQKVILFNPTLNKVIDIGPLNSEDGELLNSNN